MLKHITCIASRPITMAMLKIVLFVTIYALSTMIFFSTKWPILMFWIKRMISTECTRPNNIRSHASH